MNFFLKNISKNGTQVATVPARLANTYATSLQLQE
jgi:hypothetical protein